MRNVYDVAVRGETGVHYRVEFRRYAVVFSLFLATEILFVCFLQSANMEKLDLLTEVNSPYVSSTRRVHNS